MFVKNFLSVAALAALSVSATCFGDDVNTRYKLDPDFPSRIEDAYPVKFGDAYIKYTSRYGRQRSGTDRTTATPEVAAGIAPNVDLHISESYYIGDADHTGSGDTNINSQWMFLEEKQGEWWPALAVEGTVLLPTGRESEGLDTGLQFLLTKTLDWGPHFDEVHLNVQWNHNFIHDTGERSDYYVAVAGYTRRLVENIVLDTDVYWQQAEARRTNAQGAEVGLIYVLGDNVLLAGGVGSSLGDDAANFEATVGVIVSK